MVIQKAYRYILEYWIKASSLNDLQLQNIVVMTKYLKIFPAYSFYSKDSKEVVLIKCLTLFSPGK